MVELPADDGIADMTAGLSMHTTERAGSASPPERHSFFERMIKRPACLD